jgi:uncharacterized protein
MTDPVPPPPPQRVTHPTAAAEPSPLLPTAPGERQLLLDVLRGVALLGIFMVNMPTFAMPFFEAFGGPGLATDSTRNQVGWWVVTLLFQFKFISLFSLLFGAGFALQIERAQARGRPFVWTYLRRLAMLFVIGIIHALLIWYGDILVAYSILGLLLIPFARAKASTLLITGVVLLLLSSALGAGLGALEAVMARQADASTQSASEEEVAAPEHSLEVREVDGALEPDALELGSVESGSVESGSLEPGSLEPAVIEPEAAETEASSEGPLRGMDALIELQFNPTDPRWAEAETAAFRDGPFADALAFRITIWAFAIIVGLFSWLWHPAALFLIGAGLMRLGFFRPEASSLRARFAWLIIPGLALELLVPLSATRANWEDDMLSTVLAAGHAPSAVLLMLGYVGLLSILVDRAASNAVLGGTARFVAALGRMPLTAYLSESVLAALLMYWYGLGWFGSVDRIQQIGLVLLIWLGLALAANLWFRAFSYGPMEWLWRLGTYGRRGTAAPPR